MDFSDITSIAAFLVSLLSLYLSFSSTRLSKRVSAAEKRTQIHCALIGIQIKSEDLITEAHVALERGGIKSSLSNLLEHTEDQLTDVVKQARMRSESLRRNAYEDLLGLEEYWTYVLESEARLENLAEQMREVLSDPSYHEDSERG